MPRESLLEAAKATNNPYLLDPANLPKEYQDETTKYFFADARVALNDKFKSDQRAAVAANNAQRIADRNQADEEVYALYVCLICMPYMYAVYVCLVCMPCMYALYV